MMATPSKVLASETMSMCECVHHPQHCQSLSTKWISFVCVISSAAETLKSSMADRVTCPVLHWVQQLMEDDTPPLEVLTQLLGSQAAEVVLIPV